jgi:aconitate hydratase
LPLAVRFGFQARPFRSFNQNELSASGRSRIMSILRHQKPLDCEATLEAEGVRYRLHSLEALERQGFSLSRLPCSLKILVENLLRHAAGADDIEAITGDPCAWREIAFRPARVLLQDFTGVPAVADLAAMRDAMAALGGDPRRINPLQPVELVIDHSMQVDAAGVPDAMEINRGLDYRRNRERYEFLRWGQQAFRNFKVVPPYTGICHQVNLEYLARVVSTSDEVEEGPSATGPVLAYPDTVVGCDSHTPMVNGLGVLGWGVGGIEAEAAMLGQPISMLVPEVIGFRLDGELQAGCTATDLVLTIAQMLRAKGVVGKFVEFFGPGVDGLSIAHRATIGNMSPEYGATCAFFPVDARTLEYLRLTGRPSERIRLVEAYTKAQGMFRTPDTPAPVFPDTLELDLSKVEPSIAGPRRPQDRVRLGAARQSFIDALASLRPADPVRAEVKDAAIGKPGGGMPLGVWGESPGTRVPVHEKDCDECQSAALEDGSVVIASITSCTNTSNPEVMLAAGILARKAVARGLRCKAWVKTSLAPGSQVVTSYLQDSGLDAALDALGFQLVGYGCGTCIGNSGPLPEAISHAIEHRHLVVCSVLSGNRNFEGRIHSEVRANYLMSPPLVVAFALAGRIDIDLEREPLATDAAGREVFLRDLWPTPDELTEALSHALQAGLFTKVYANVYRGDALWNALPSASSDRYRWLPESTYVKRPPFFEGMAAEPPRTLADIRGARILAILGDSVTTDHISPAGSIRRGSPAGEYLRAHGVAVAQFNSYGARRGNHEVMMRGTFANGRIRNLMLPGVEGGLAIHLPSGDVLSIFDVAERYTREGTPLIVLAGKEYGTGSSRDWAAKGPRLLGVVVVIAESFERIHRSNLVGMGILPLQFLPGENPASLGLTGKEAFAVHGIDEAGPGRRARITATADDGRSVEFAALVRLDTAQEVLYYRHGGILPYMLRRLAGGEYSEAGLSAPLEASVATEYAAWPARPDVDEGSIESFPASDPPSR